MAITAIGAAGIAVSYPIGPDSPPIATWIALVPYVGIVLMPIAIGIAILRYRLFEIDRIISRTIGWAVVTGILGAVFAGTIVGLQGILADVTQAQTLSVAASTLVAFVLFQPVRRRVQSAVDHRFNRARYDAEQTAAAFGERQRDQVNIAGLKVDIAGTIDSALRPQTVGCLDPADRPGRDAMIRRSVAVLAWLLAVSMTALWVWVIVLGEYMTSMMAAVPAEERLSLNEGWWIVAYVAMAGVAIVTIANSTVGFLLASRHGGGRMGVILLAAGVTFAAVPFGYVVGGSLTLHDPLDPVASALLLIGPASYAFAYSLILPVVALAFPDGRLPSRRWRWPSGLALGALAAAATLVVVTPGGLLNTASMNPFGVAILPRWLTSLADPLNAIGSVLISVLGVAAVVTRYRRGSGLERQQLRWLLAAVLLAAVPFTISIVGGGVNWILLALPGIILVPVAVGIAVTRHRLYDIDRLISRGLSWAVLSGLLVAVYAGAVLLLQSVLSGATQGETLAVAGSTLLAAALFQPLRRRVQAIVDHRFNRASYDADRTVAAFSAQLRDEIDPNQIRASLVAAVGVSVSPTRVDLWLRDRPR